MIAPLRSLVAGFVLGSVCASASAAQGKSTNTIKSCGEAACVVRNGRPSHKQTAALNFLLECGPTGAAATIIALEQTRSESELLALTEFYLLMRSWRDAAVMQAALKLARDPGASIPARVHSIAYLLELVHPGRIYGYDALVEGIRSTHVPCVRGLANHSRGSSVGEVLPSDYAAQVEAGMRSLIGEVTAPPEVRNAASCVDF